MYDKQIVEQLKDDKQYYSGLGKEYISNSHISQLLKDPASYGEPTPPIESVEMLLGSLLHDMMEDHIKNTNIITKKYTVVEGFREGMSFEANKVSEDEFKNVLGWRDTYLKNKTIQVLLEGDLEVEKPAIGEIEGLPFKCKSDVINHSKKLIIDWKTTAKSVDSFGSYGFGTWNYDSAYYIYKELNPGYDMVFVVISKKHSDVMIYFPTDNQWYRGKDKVQLAARNYKTFCLKEEGTVLNTGGPF